MAAYEETLVNITLDAHPDLASDTAPPNEGPGDLYRFVQVSGERQVNLFGNASGDICVGVLQSKPQVDDMACTVAISGVSLVEAGGEIDAGDAVGASATGKADSSSTPVLGIALRGASAEGQLIPVLLRLTGEAASA